MKNVLRFAALLILFTGFAGAQVIADFEEGTNGFSDGDWGVFVTSIEQVADPTGLSSSVLAVNIDATQTGGDPKDPMVAYSLEMDTEPMAMVYYLYLPEGTPDGIDIKTFAQDDPDWQWADNKHSTTGMPRDTWYPVYFNLKNSARNGHNYSQKINAYGIEFAGWELAGDDTSYTGTIYVDNVSLIGAEPFVKADFEDPDAGTQGVITDAWGNAIPSIERVDDPSGESDGVLAVNFDSNLGLNDPIYMSNVTGLAEMDMVSYDIWVPADAPDSLLVKVFSQDEPNWTWQDNPYYLVDIPRDQWYTLTFSLSAKTAEGGNFTIKANRLGIEFDMRGIPEGTVSWTGQFFIDNIHFNGVETGDKWVMVDFEAQAAGTVDFKHETWGPAGQATLWAPDPSGRSTGVLQHDLDFSAGTKTYVNKGGINTHDPQSGANASAVSFDIWLPEDLPSNMQVSVVCNPSIGGWEEDIYVYYDADSTELKAGDWNTVYIDLLSRYEAETVDPLGVQGFGVQLYDRTESTTWTGSIYLDNMTLYGLTQPEGELAAVPFEASVVDTTTTESGTIVNTVRFDWVDNTLGTETYSIYWSENPITDLQADGVYKIFKDIPHGLQKYAHRPWTNDGGMYDYYYAITVLNQGEETPLATEGSVGPIAIQTTETMKVKYVADFADAFVLDGLASEFEGYAEYEISPETAGGTYGDEWAPGSADLDFKVTMIIDDEYLYISADVTDDDLRTDEAMQAWEGDALEFYMGFYDAMDTKVWHGKGVDNSNGDWRIGFTARGEVALSGGSGSPDAIAGVEATVFNKFTGDGYIIEARLNLDSLTISGEDFVVTNGMMLPLRIDNNDWDPTMGDESRSLILQVGGTPTADDIDMNEDWTRPHAWGMLEVVDAPTSVSDDVAQVPLEYALYNNYPNPFNPATTIKYSIADMSVVKVTVYDVLGAQVATLVNQQQAAGRYEVTFDASDLASGMYIYHISAGEFQATKKMMLLK